MDTSHNGVEAVTMTEILGLDSWNQPRTSEDLQAFITRKHEELDTLDLSELEEMQ